jgi:hypothetical protein
MRHELRSLSREFDSLRRDLADAGSLAVDPVDAEILPPDTEIEIPPAEGPGDTASEDTFPPPPAAVLHSARGGRLPRPRGKLVRLVLGAVVIVTISALTGFVLLQIL